MSRSATPNRTPSSACSGDAALRNIGWYSIGVPTLVCLLGTFAILVVLDVFYAPSNGLRNTFHKSFPNGWSNHDYAQRSFQGSTYRSGAKPAAAIATAPIIRHGKSSNSGYEGAFELVDDSVPLDLAMDGTDRTASAADSTQRSASALVDSETQQIEGYERDTTFKGTATGSDQGKQITEDEVHALLTAEGQLYGKVEKAGMLPTDKWLPPKNGRDETIKPLNKWLWDTLLGTDDGDMPVLPPGESPPKAGICTLLFNPTYKFILVKNTKVAGTSLFLKFGGFCPPGVTLETSKKIPNCLWRVTDITRVGLAKLGYSSFEEMWDDYNVLALVRNPYDRAGSSYDYTLGRRTNREDDCRDPTFQHFTAKPYVIGLQDTLFSCGERVHDFYHVEPQHTCLLDDDRNLVVDWVIRVNSLVEDLEPVLFELNRRRIRGAPRLKGGIGWEQRGPIADDGVKGGERKADVARSRHASKFIDCGSACIQNVKEYYRKDFELLQYPMDTSGL